MVTKEQEKLIETITKASETVGLEILDTEVWRELSKLDVSKKYSVSQIGKIMHDAKERAKKRLEEIR